MDRGLFGPIHELIEATIHLSTVEDVKDIDLLALGTKHLFFLLAAAWVGPGRSALQSAEQWCKRRYGRIHQVGKMSFCDKNMHKGRLKQHTKGSETGNHPQKVPRLQKRAPVMSQRQPLCRRECNSIGRRWLW